ncbi:MAG: GNAT family N-acetyltransferase [Rhodospirillaceae bacterium]
MTSHPLDQPVWSALTTRQAQFAVGRGLAMRFAADVSPFAAARDDSPASTAALAALVPPRGYTVVMHAWTPQPGIVVEKESLIVRMVAAGAIGTADTDSIQPLTEADAPEMLALATLTEPGPFLARTHRLGSFWGIKEGNRLVAMAGERLRPPGFTEVSGVCTHPDARGRGYARKLSSLVAREIAARGEIPFLHAYATNTNAVRLYESLGFAIRCQVAATMLRRA